MSCNSHWAGLPTGDCLKFATLEFRGVFLDVVTVVCFLVKYVVVHFEYQKHVHFRNGLGFWVFWGGAKCDRLQAKCVKALGFVFIL
jgi:hypothetical protein